MSLQSSIEWTDATWNPVRGCTKISAGCKHCYAETFAERFRGVKGHPYERGFDLRLVPEKLAEPLRWAESRVVFVNSMSDLFHEDVPEDYIVEVAKVMKMASWHTFQVLTKRAERLSTLLQTKLRFASELPHIWWGVSVENRKHGILRIAYLQNAPAAVRFLSIEPLLEYLGEINLQSIDWVIVGGESGPGARAMKKDWVVSIRDQCRRSEVAFFFKQWGGTRKSIAGRLLEGRTYDEYPPVVRDSPPPHVEELRSARSILRGRGKFPTFRCLFIESDPERFGQLKTFCGQVHDIPVRIENWDFRDHISDVVAFAKQVTNSFPFVFMDPTGWEPITVQTIAPVLRLQPGEVLINLMTSWIRRFLRDESKNFERLLGKTTGRLRELHGDEQEQELVRAYSEAVRLAGGFQYVCNLPVLMPDRDALHFNMVYGTRSIKGVEEFKRAEKSTNEFMHVARHQAQTRKRAAREGEFFPGFEPSYQESRYSRLRESNLEIARQRLEQRLRKEKCVDYDIAWGEAMQYAAVQEPDLKEWIKQWHSMGRLGFEGLEAAAKLPRHGMGHVLKWLGDLD